MSKKYAVIGAGNGGKLTASLLASKGYEVALMDKNPDVIAAINSWDNTIEVIGKVECKSKIPMVTTDLAAAVKGAEIIFVVTTADQHYNLSCDLGACIEAGQIVVLTPGQTGGLLEVSSTLKEKSGLDITVASMQDLVYGARLKEPGVVNCSAAKKVMDFIAYPVSETENLMALLADVFPMLRKAAGILNLDFDNMSSMIHPAPTLLNAARTENGQIYRYYGEGITPAVAAFMEKLDAERIAVGAAYGIEVTSLAQWQLNAYDVTGGSLYEVFQNNPFYQAINAADTIRNRFVTEDVPCGLVPITAYARAAGVPTPAMDAMITIACAMLGEDYRTSGRTLEKLGLAGLSVEEICARLK